MKHWCGSNIKRKALNSIGSVKNNKGVGNSVKMLLTRGIKNKILRKCDSFAASV